MDLLNVTGFPPSPPTFGAQRRIDGLFSALARRHRVTCVSALSPDFDPDAARRAMGRYCEEVAFVRTRRGWGPGRRALHLRSIVSSFTFERLSITFPALQVAIDGLLARRRFDWVVVEAPFFAWLRLRQAPPGLPAPRLLLDAHNVEHMLAQRSEKASRGARRLYHSLNWRKMKREEIEAWGRFDGVAFTSDDDLAEARGLLPSIRGAVVPNAVDVEYFAPGADLPPPDRRTVLFFGTLDYFPNQDGIRFFMRKVWPALARSRPNARLKLVGPRPTPEVLSWRGPRVEVTGLVEDLRPHLAAASVIVVPLRVGGGTRLKILEALAMGRPVVSTTIGAEGLCVTHERELLIADDPSAFVAQVERVLDDPALGAHLGAGGRSLVERRYSWLASAMDLERLMVEAASHPPRQGDRP